MDAAKHSIQLTTTSRPKTIEMPSFRDNSEASADIFRFGKAESRMSALSKVGLSPYHMSHLPFGQETVKFHIDAFLEQLLYHMAYPLSIPLVYLCRGKSAVINLRFLPIGQSFGFFIQIIFSGLIWVAIGCWGASITLGDTADSEPFDRMMVLEIVLLILSSTFQRCAIATKYALLSSRQYNYVMTTAISPDEMNRDQLLVSWDKLADATLDVELEAAAVRLGINARCIQFESSAVCHPLLMELTEMRPGRAVSDSKQVMSTKPARSSHSVMENPMVSPAPVSDVEEVDVYSVTARIIRRSVHGSMNMNKKMTFGILFGTVAAALIPVIVRLSYGLAGMGRSPLQHAVFACCFITQVGFPLLVFNYMRVAILDYRRRCNSFKRLGKLVAFTGKGGSQANRAISLFTSDSIVAWMQTRRLLNAFGMRYFKRIQAYQSQALLLCVLCLAGLLIVLGLYPRSSDAMPALVSFSASTLFYVVGLGACVLVCLKYGAAANEQADIHAAILDCLKFELLAAQQDAAPLAGILLTQARDIILHDRRVDPVRIVGVPASLVLVRTMSAALVSAASVAARLLIS